MSKAQRVIKYLAIAFGIFLSVNIIGAIIIGIASISGAFFGSKIVLWNYDTISYTKSFEDIKKLDIEIGGADLSIKQGDEFKVDAQDIPEKYQVTAINGTLKISNKGMNIVNGTTASITLYIPSEAVLENADIETGAGRISIESLKTKKLELDLGAGHVTIKDISAEKADISCGAGKVEIENADLSNLDLDAGIGELVYTGYIKGNSKIDCGVGETTLNLLGGENLYSIRADKGIGEIEYNGRTASNGVITSFGENNIDIDGGIGKITIITK